MQRRLSTVTCEQTPGARCGHTAVVLDPELVPSVTGSRSAGAAMIVFGGDDGTGRHRNDVCVLEVAQRRGAVSSEAPATAWKWTKWRVGGDVIPSGRALHTAIAVNDRCVGWHS